MKYHLASAYSSFFPSSLNYIARKSIHRSNIMTTRLLYGADSPPILRCFDLKTSKITVMGDDDSGKTSLVRNWLNSTFQNSDPNHYRVSDIYHKTVQFNYFKEFYHTFVTAKAQLSNDVYHAVENPNTVGSYADILEKYMIDANICNNKSVVGRRTKINVQISDTNQMDISCYSDLTTVQIKQSDAIILCFDSTNESSFASLEYYICTIHQVSLESKLNIPIIIACTKCDLVSERTIYYDRILAFLQDLNFSPDSLDYFETSSKLDINVEELFFAALLKIEKSKNDCRKLLQGFINGMYPANNSPSLIKNGKAREIETQEASCISIKSQLITSSLEESKDSKRLITKKSGHTSMKMSPAKSLTRGSSNGSPSSDERKKLKKCIMACCVM